MTKRVIVLINECSRRAKHLNVRRQVASALCANDPSITIAATQPGKVVEQARQFAKEADLVVAVGGDGTVQSVGEGLAGSGAALGIIPTGTGNDLARTLGILLDVVKAVQVLFGGEPQPMDAVRYRCRGGEGLCLNVAGVGFDAAVAQRVNQGFRFMQGTAAYLTAVALCLTSYRPARISLSVDGRRFEVDAMLCAVANAQYYSGGMKIVPHARVDDGRLDGVIVFDVSKMEFLRQFPRVFRGTHIRHPAVQTFQGEKVSIESARPMPVLVDGEIVGSTLAEFEIVPGALRVVRPA